MKTNSLRSAVFGVFAVISIALSMTFGLVIITGHSPHAAFLVVKTGLLDWQGQDDVLVKCCPLLLCALAVVVPLRAGLYNVGGEGQMYIGALCATIPALFLPSSASGFTILVCSICAMVGGALWASIAGLLKAYRGTNEVITTLLLNYVAVQVVSIVVSGPLKAEGAPYPYSDIIQPTAVLATLTEQGNVHWGLIFGMICAAILWFIFSCSTFGLSLRIVGESRKVAAYAGVKVNQTQILALCIGGAAAGMAGGFEVLAVKHRLFHLFAGSYGYEGLVVAFLAMGHPLWCIASAYLIATLKVSGNLVQRNAEIPASVVSAFEGLVVILVAVLLAVRFRLDHLPEDVVDENIDTAKLENSTERR